jgi:hypothetical protein
VALADVATAADSLSGFRVYDPPLAVELVDKAGDAEKGWSVIGSAIKGSAFQFCAVKDSEVEWRSSTDPNLKWVT